MTIALAKDVEDYLQNQVRRGACADANELVNDIIRSFSQQQEGSLEVTPELEKWLLEAAEKATTPLTRNDFNSIRERVRSRLKS